MVYEDPRWLARVVAELDEFLRRIEALRDELCQDVVYKKEGGVLCKNMHAGSSEELGAV